MRGWVELSELCGSTISVAIPAPLHAVFIVKSI